MNLNDTVTIAVEVAERAASALSLRLTNARKMLVLLEKDGDEEGAEFYRDIIARDNYSKHTILNELRKKETPTQLRDTAK